MTDFTPEFKQEMLAWEVRKKQLVIKTAKDRGIKLLIETGTCHGHMVAACLDTFDRIISIELAEIYFRESHNRFSGNLKVQIVYGDSGVLLRRILENEPKQPAVFWIDAHCSGGQTAGDPDNPPLTQELKAIFDVWDEGVILIDDQHLTPEEVCSWRGRYRGFRNEDNISIIDIAEA